VIVSRTAEYALRAMACLAGAARDPEQGVLRSEELAQAAQIPAHYVSKVMRQLVIAGLVEARRGHGGGFRLAREPGEVTFAAILQAMGEVPDDDRCAFGLESCGGRNPCPLHESWSRLRSAFEHWASTTTLADVDP